MKAAKRRELRDEYNSLSPTKRAALVKHSLAEMQALPPPHRTLEEVEAMHQDPDNNLSLAEVTGRTTALRKARTPQPRTLDTETALRMLALTDDADLSGDIVAMLSGTDALAVAEKIENPDTRELLLRHVLTAMAGGR